jgi:hypothetical protein
MALQLPLRTEELMIFLAEPPRESVDFTTKRPRLDPEGRALFEVPVVLIGLGGAQVARIRCPQTPRNAAPGQQLKVTALTVFYWETDGNSGISFRAERIEAIGQPGPGGSPKAA